MSSGGAFILALAILLAGCSSQRVGPEELGEMQVYSVELPKRNAGNRDAGNSESILESSVIQGAEAEQAESKVQIKPAVVLHQTYTVQVGVFDEAAGASLFVSDHQLDATESGIATVTLDGEKKYLLAFGMYSSREDAESALNQISSLIQSSELSEPLKIVRLDQIKAVSEVVNTDSDILEIGSF